jgi:PadR family transcriptional regulator, regulatory protein PadR
VRCGVYAFSAAVALFFGLGLCRDTTYNECMIYSKLTDDLPVLGQWELRVLLALAKGRMTGYQIGTQCSEDAVGETKLSNGSLYPAIKRLEQFGYVEGVVASRPRPGREARTYVLTRKGRMVLELEVTGWRRMVRLAENRL